MPTPSEEIEKAGEFILKIARAPSMGDVEATEAILTQLRSVRNNPFFASMYERLVPANYDSTTKVLSEGARNRLTQATHLYAEGVMIE